MSVSRYETMIQNLLTEYRTITVANGYRNNLSACVVYGIKPIDKVMNEIEIGVQAADENIEISDNGTEFESRADIYIEATVKVGLDDTEAVTKVESVTHDLKRCTAKLIIKYITGTYRWNVTMKNGILAYHDVFSFQGKSVHRVGVKYSVHLMAQDEGFV